MGVMKETLMSIDSAQQVRDRALERVARRLVDNGYVDVPEQDQIRVHGQIADFLLDAAKQVISTNLPEAVLTPKQTGHLLEALLASADQLQLETAELDKSLDRLQKRLS